MIHSFLCMSWKHHLSHPLKVCNFVNFPAPDYQLGFFKLGCLLSPIDNDSTFFLLSQLIGIITYCNVAVVTAISQLYPSINLFTSVLKILEKYSEIFNQISNLKDFREITFQRKMAQVFWTLIFSIL